MVELIVSPEYLKDNEKVLIIDDFLASGQTILGLVRLAEASGSKVVGIGALIEKIFEGGASMRNHRANHCGENFLADFRRPRKKEGAEVF
jgi:xanthine phosphoribosyltransferase